MSPSSRPSFPTSEVADPASIETQGLPTLLQTSSPSALPLPSVSASVQTSSPSALPLPSVSASVQTSLPSALPLPSVSASAQTSSPSALPPTSPRPLHLTHLDPEGAAQMVDISHKEASRRQATARAVVSMKPETLVLLLQKNLPKGDALQVARVAGILAAKRTPDLIPLCHPIPLSKVEIHFQPLDASRLQILATLQNLAPTGVEMEALTAATIAALTVYDMAKGIDPHMVISDIAVLEKKGGKTGDWRLEGKASP